MPVSSGPQSVKYAKELIPASPALESAKLPAKPSEADDLHCKELVTDCVSSDTSCKEQRISQATLSDASDANDMFHECEKTSEGIEGMFCIKSFIIPCLTRVLGDCSVIKSNSLFLFV